MFWPRYSLILFAATLFLMLPAAGKCQDSTGFFSPATTYNPKRTLLVASGTGAVYVASMVGLYQIWYKDYNNGEFHFFNDAGEWLQVDKAGHFGSAYYLTNWGSALYRWTGMKRNTAAWLGGGSAMAFLTTIELFDGYSDQWGFSVSDMIANTGGTVLSMAQEFAFREQRIKVKFSYHETSFPEYRPELLGETGVQKLFKDYNGQTYWLSCNLRAFAKQRTWLPPWLNVAVGYGAEGMTGARDNDLLTPEQAQGITRYRQYYLAPDIDLTRIRFRSGFLKTVAGVFGFIKIPAPTLEMRSTGKAVFHWFYF